MNLHLKTIALMLAICVVVGLVAGFIYICTVLPSPYGVILYMSIVGAFWYNMVYTWVKDETDKEDN